MFNPNSFIKKKHIYLDGRIKTFEDVELKNLLEELLLALEEKKIKMDIKIERKYFHAMLVEDYIQVKYSISVFINRIRIYQYNEIEKIIKEVKNLRDLEKIFTFLIRNKIIRRSIKL